MLIWGMKLKENNFLKSKKNANLVISFVVFSVIFLSLCAFAVDMTVFLTARGQIQHATENAALAAASSFNETSTEQDVENVASSVISMFKTKGKVLQNLYIAQIDVKKNARALKIQTEAPVPTYFLGVVGLGYVYVRAQSSARASKVWLDENSPRVVNEYGIVISEGPVMQDTKIVKPLSSEPQKIDYTVILKEPDNNALSLGQGGYLTIRLPHVVMDKPGNDLYIEEAGIQEGYYVFAGRDKDFQYPYLDKDSQGEGIEWVNISCLAQTKEKRTFKVDNRVKVYGSASFDLGAKCSDGSYNADIAYAQYIRIVDDNEENGFENEDATRAKYFFGESSGATSGADIDAIAILNYAKLIKSSDFNSL